MCSCISSFIIGIRKVENVRVEGDFIGKVNVPDDAYYGSFTVRAKKNFQLSRTKVHMEFIYAVALIKKCAALANMDLGRMERKEGKAIVKAADDVLDGKLDDQFILDAFQAGAGTPLHMNVNEVIANRAEEILGGKKGEYKMVHPNNHVNMAQSSNNVIPSGVKIAAIKLSVPMIKEAEKLQKSLEKKAKKYKNTMKIGRTHLQDAVPMTYGQIFDAYARALEKDIEVMKIGAKGIGELGIGGTATGSGITAHPQFRKQITKHLSKYVPVWPANDAIEMTQNMNDLLTFSESLRRYAVTLTRIANDLRLLSSGPKAGIAEIILPEVEPGSSIMPGKLNPSVPEAVNMVCYQVIANDHAVMLSAQSGQLELNWCAPLIAHNILQSEELLENCSIMFRECIEKSKVNEKQTAENFNRTFGYATALNPYLGYSRVSKLVTEAYKKGVSLKDLIVKKGIMSRADLEKVIATAKGPALVDKKIKERIK
jgi:aspartate ammonia-lyase